MNLYRVTGRVQLVEHIETNGQDYYERETKRMSLEVEATSEAQAIEKAIQECRNLLVDQNWDWHEDYPAPKVELLREITEAEMMRRINAPRLFE